MARSTASADIRRRAWVVCAALAAFAVPAMSEAAAPGQVLEVGPVRVVVEPWRHGMRIVCDGVTVSVGSNMVVTDPPWAPHYYLGPSADAVSSAKQEMIETGVRLRMQHRDAAGAFDATDTITLTADGRVVRELEGRFLGEKDEMLLQWQIAGINPAVIIGRPFTATLADGTVKTGTVPVVPTAETMEAGALAKGFKTIEFDSRLGPIRIDVEGTPTVLISDYRKNRWSDPANPLFWFGENGARCAKNKSFRYRIVYRLPVKREAATAPPPVKVAATTTDRPTAQTVPWEKTPTIIPKPKQATFGDGGFVLRRAADTKPNDIVIDVESDPEGRASSLTPSAVKELAALLHERYAIPIREQSGPQQSEGPSIRFRLASPESTLPKEGYELEVASDGATIRAADAHGFFYAVQTLKQLATTVPNGDVVIRTATIRDWPSLSFRGVHLFTGGQGAELHERLIRNVLAALKMNHLVLEAEYVKWDSHPEIHHPEFGMNKEEARRIAALCRQQQIELIPLVQSLGHCQWMFTNDQNLDLCEDPAAQWAYCVTNPKTYDFIHEIYEEAVQLFAPKYFHIGHDEFDHRGRVPHRAESKKYTVDELLMMDIRRHHEWFSERGIKLMLWGDMFLGKDEAPDAGHADSAEAAQALREQLPTDVVVTDWHYVDRPPAEYVNLDKFHASGHATVASTWYRPGNIIHFARAAYEKKSLGLLQTTWAGYSLDPASFKRSLDQYCTYVLAAETAWNADAPPSPERFPWQHHFLDLMGLSTLRPARRAGWTADLSTAYNESLTAFDADGWFGLGPAHDLSAAPHGLTTLKGVTFELASSPKRSAVVLRGKLAGPADYPGAVEIEVQRKADWLAILHTANFPATRGTKVAGYEVRYADDTRAMIDLLYGTNLFAYTDLSAAPEASAVWTGTNKAGQGVALRALIWKNPHPDRAIRSITARTANAGPSLVLLGITGLNQGSRNGGSVPRG